jgi:hypothetical protein
MNGGLHFALTDVSLCSVRLAEFRKTPREHAPHCWHGSCLSVSSKTPLRTAPERSPMDLVYLGLTVGFFFVSWAFVVACDRLS